MGYGHGVYGALPPHAVLFLVGSSLPCSCFHAFPFNKYMQKFVMHGLVDIVSSWCRTLLQSVGSSASNKCVCRSDSVTRLVQVDIVFELFGDKDGSLDSKAFMRALQYREGPSMRGAMGFEGSAPKCWVPGLCARGASS